MKDLEKLKHLANHWEEHNRDHGETYRMWANKMKESGEPEVTRVLEEIADRTSDLDKLFSTLTKALK